MKNKKIPMRRCIGCMESKPKNELIRIVSYEGNVSIDFTGKANGRGVYLCHDTDCFQKAQKKRAIGRGLETELSKDQTDSLFEELRKNEEQN